MDRKIFAGRISDRGTRRCGRGAGLIPALALLLVPLALYAAPASTPTAAPPTRVAPGAAKNPLSPNFEQQWAKLAAAAKQEGQLIVNFGRSGARDYGSFFKAFEEKFGIRVTVGRGSGRDQINRTLAERAGGVFKMDVLATGLSSLLQRMVPSGALEPMENVLFHPEVVDKSLWRDGVHRYADKEQKLIFLMAGRTDATELAINTKLLKPDSIGSYRELLDPKRRGRIVTWHPVLHPIAEAGMGSIFYSKELGPEWFPLLMPTLILLGTLHFVIAANSTSSIILLAARDTVTLSILALEYTALGFWESASVISLLIMALTVGVALVARAFGLRLGVRHQY